jgi:hypothetical protein
MTWETASLLGIAIGFAAAVAMMADRAAVRGGFVVAALALAACHAGASLGWRLVLERAPAATTLAWRPAKLFTDRVPQRPVQPVAEGRR